MKVLQILATVVVACYAVVVLLLYLFQTRLIFFPGSLDREFSFKLGATGEEVFIHTADGEEINGIFYRGTRKDVILYFHGNAGDLRGWQFISEDFLDLGFNLLLVDYRGYGKSSGTISEKGLYLDAEAAYDFLINEKKFRPDNVVVYGRSIGTGVAVTLAAVRPCKGLVLESPLKNLGELSNSKLPFFFPSLYLKYRFDNASKIQKVKCPLIVIHGENDTLIPASHGIDLYKRFKGRKKLILIKGGAHNDLSAFEDYHFFLVETLPEFFD